MKYLLIFLGFLIFSGCNTHKHSLFPEGVMHREHIRTINNERDIKENFENLNPPEWHALFLFHYPDLVVPTQLASELRVLPPSRIQRPIWVYMEERRYVSFTENSYEMHIMDDRMQVLFEYGFPDNIDRFNRRDGVLEKWDYYRAGVSFTFLDGAEYRSTQY